MKISEMIPYERNAWNNDEGVPAIAQSIKDFGFRGQIKLWKRDNPVIISGHHRVKALKLLGWEELPDEHIQFCEDMTEQDVKAFRLADNRTGQTGKWNKGLEKAEIKSLQKMGVDMSKYKFDFKSKHLPYGAEILKSDKEWNMLLCNRYDCIGKWEMPILEPADACPDDLISFNFCKSTADFSPGVHFCIDDYQFERVWRNPQKYIDLLRKFDCVVCPDFSIYIDMPLPMKLWNLYKSRALGHWWQQEGLTVIPNVTWSDESSFDYCFADIPKGGTIFISTVGVTRDKEANKLVIKGLERVMEEIKPSRILLLGTKPKFDFGNTEIKLYKPMAFKR